MLRWLFGTDDSRVTVLPLVPGRRYRLRLPWPENVAAWRYDGAILIDDDTTAVLRIEDERLADCDGCAVGMVGDLEPA